MFVTVSRQYVARCGNIVAAIPALRARWRVLGERNHPSARNQLLVAHAAIVDTLNALTVL